MTRHVLLLHYTPPGVVGGVENILHEHRRLLRDRGFEVTVVAGRPADGVQVIPQLDSAAPGSKRVEAELDASAVSPRFFRQASEIRVALEPFIRSAEAVIVHNALTLHFNLSLTAALWRLAAEHPHKIVAWTHDLSWTNPLYMPLLHPGYPWDLLRVPAPGVHYVTVSELRAAELRALWRTDEPIQVIPNGIDPSDFLRLSPTISEIVERCKIFDRDVVLLLPVRVTRRKNIEAGIRAVHALAAKGLDVLFLVSGPQAPHHPGGSDRYLEELRSLRRDLGVDANVIFLAADLGLSLGPRDVAELYTVADALLFPSAQEGFGLPILEAGLSRLPVVVSDIPIFREVGGAGVFTIAPDEGADKMAETILNALNNRSAHLRRRVLNRYRWDVIADTQLVPLVTGRSGRPALSTF